MNGLMIAGYTLALKLIHKIFLQSECHKLKMLMFPVFNALFVVLYALRETITCVFFFLLVQ